MASAFTQGLGELFLCVTKPVHQLLVAGGLFHRVQIRALDVFDNRNFQHFRIIEITYNHRDIMQLRHLRRGGHSYRKLYAEKKRLREEGVVLRYGMIPAHRSMPTRMPSVFATRTIQMIFEASTASEAKSG